MGSAEARAPQRTNYEFVQEDMTKASRFSYYSSSSKSESVDKPGDVIKSSDCPVPDCMRRMDYSWKSSNPNLPPKTKWWCHPQPNCAHHKDISPEQLNALELEVLSAGFVEQIGKFSGVMNTPVKEYGIQPSVKGNVSSFLSKPWKVSATCVKDDQDPKIQEHKGASNSLHEVPKNNDMAELLFADDHLVDLDYINLASEEPEKLCSELESHWIEAERTVPWWRTSDKDEWASLVSLKSLEHAENCDLAQPMTENLGRAVSASPQCSYHCKIVESSSDEKAIKEISNPADYKQGCSTSTSMDEKQCTPGYVEGLSHGLDRAFSNNGSSRTTSTDNAENPQRPWADLSKTELLEALCHSQTRAREAEKAAQQAYNEKEHIVTLFLRQASHLFAYRQWFQILQLQNLFLQLKNKDEPTSIHLPPFLPWVPSKGWQMKKGRHNPRKRKLQPPPPRNKIRKCAVAFALGLSLTGAGLFLGWTMGWFFPGL